MKGEISYYKILGVDENASNHELRKAFCKLSIELHPDTTSLEIEDAKSKFQEVLEAYENLNNSNLRKIYDEKLKEKSRSKNNNREKFQIIKIPMPSPVFIKKKRVPASYLNFLITNKKVLLPMFNVKEDKKVIKIFRNFFKNKKIIPIDCSKLIWGFGAIHCMTQQEPKF